MKNPEIVSPPSEESEGKYFSGFWQITSINKKTKKKKKILRYVQGNDAYFPLA